MVLIPCLAVNGSLHKGLRRHIQFPQTVDYDMHMNVAAAIMPVHVRTDQCLMPRDRTGNRRFIPIPVDAAQAEVHILDNEAESRAYIDQLWAEAMTIYNSGDYKLTFSPVMQEALQICQKDFMQEDTQAGMIYAFLEDYTGDRVCSKQLYAEALGNLNLPAEWETRAICEIMTAGIANGEIKGWTAHKAAKRYPKYGVQKGWGRVTAAKVDTDSFVELTDEEAQQMGFPF